MSIFDKEGDITIEYLKSIGFYKGTRTDLNEIDNLVKDIYCVCAASVGATLKWRGTKDKDNLIISFCSHRTYSEKFYTIKDRIELEAAILRTKQYILTELNYIYADRKYTINDIK